ncbi:filamentous hemagglutinin N-terminal domain-containing protein [Paraburkholderia diazotrophica]|uniref:two-partner secretion domain-containing protein n=1 Tax=Paraburkholderia diazotrophica TaxID=667676 RepID=UPI003181566E
MNKNRFRRVFSKRLGMLVAVAENVMSQGKQPGEGTAAAGGAELGVISTMTAFALALLVTQPDIAHAQALPTGGQVTAGQATISQPNGNTLTINQGSQRTVIDWNSFNVGQGNTVQFNQPNAQAQALNRVTGAGASNIQGSLLANGQVLIQNANGVLFGKNAVVNVGSLLATTKSIDSNAFMAGNPLQLNSTGTNASVINDGTIQAQGYVTLMGDQARNTGTISTTPGGQVILAAGDSATVALPNGQGIQLTLTNATANALVENSGNIKADNGTVLLTARGSNTLLDTVVNMSGVTRAGTVVADAGNTGDVAVTGTIDASNRAAGGTGGTVVLSGDRVGVFGNATIDVSGDAAGGKVIIGGDSLHQLAGTQAAGMLQDNVNFANFTQVDAGASIKADSAHGNGGFVETSGHSLDVQGSVSAAAPNGKAGQWLIDPTDVTISTGADSNYSGNVSGGFSGGTNTSATVNNQTISNTLSSGTDVTITTASSGTATGNIVQNAGADIVKSGGAAANLTLAANGNITLKGNITSTSDVLNLNLTADAGHNHTGTLWQQSGTIDLNGGNLTAYADVSGQSGGNGLAFGGTVTNVGGGSITGFANTGSGVIVGGNFTEIGHGTLTIEGSSVNGTGVYFTTGTLAVTQGSTINVTGTSTNGVGIETGWTNSTVMVKDSGTLNFNGTSSSSAGTLIMSGAGAYASGGSVNVQDNGTFNVSGTSSTGNGVQFGQPQTDDVSLVSVNANGALNILGKSISGSGVSTAANFTGTGNAAITVSGTSSTGTGVASGGSYDGIGGVVNIADNVILDIHGTSTNGTGTSTGLTGNISGNGTLNINGTSTNGTGASSTFNGNLSGNATLDVNGTSTNGTGASSTFTGNLSGNSTLDVSGTSTNGTGASSSVTGNVSGNSTFDVTGTSTNGTGASSTFNGNVSGNATLGVSGTSMNGAGAYISGTYQVSQSASMNVAGTSSSGIGTEIYGANLQTADNASVNIVGRSTSGWGVASGVEPYIVKTYITETGSSKVNIDGQSGSANGVNMFDNAWNVSDSAVLNVTGTSTQSAGVSTGNPAYGYSYGTDITESNQAAVNINGTSSSGTGVSGAVLSGNISGDSTLNLTGSSVNGTGASSSFIGNLSGNATLDVNGTSTNGTGASSTFTGNLSGNSTLDVSGTSTNGTGASFTLNGNATDNAAIVLSGNSMNGTGASFTLNGNATDNAAIVLSGNSTNGSGVAIGGTSNFSQNATLDANGTSINGYGVQKNSGSNWNESGDAQINLTGTSTTSDGFIGWSGTNLTDAAQLNIKGQSDTGAGAWLAPSTSLDISGNGAVSIDGQSNTSAGVVLRANDIGVTDNGTLTVHGNSTEGTGVLQNGTSSINTSGDGEISIAGSSTNGTGVNLNTGSINTTDNGNVSIDGTSTNGKHDIKKPINTLIRRKLASLGLHDVQRKAAPVVDGKPVVLVVLVVLEWFSKNHSIYRTHSQTMVAMRDKFHLVGMGFEGRVDDAGQAVFHEFIPVKGANLWENVRHVREVSEARQAQMMYMPSVGMFPITMALACLRVAPLQLMALGHPATTHGHAMDYVVVEEDYVGDEACFSEKLLKLPSDGMPYRPPAAMLELDLPRKRATKSGPVKIAVAGTTIKMNPGFLQTCAAIANEASVPVEFHFLVGQATGLTFPQVRNLVRRLMGDKAVVHKHQNYANYMKVIAECDLFLNPFPFGNTNGIVDTVWAGLVGVCKTGREVHEHIDEGMFRRLGFPECLIAKTNDEYKTAALRLIDNAAERRELARSLAGPKAVEKLIFKGRPEILGERMQALWLEQIEAAQVSKAA